MENNITIHFNQFSTVHSNPVANATTAMSTQTHQPWSFDSGALHHVALNPFALQGNSNYGGPDEILLGDGKIISISYTIYAHINIVHRPLSSSNVLCLPNLCKI